MLKIDCAGESIVLLADKAVFWPRRRALIVADLHLGKAAAFRAAGVPVPEATTEDTLRRLTKCIVDTGALRLIVLGDFFHARAGLQSAMLDTVSRWRKDHPIEITLVPGNHDRRSGSPPASWRIEETDDDWRCPPFVFCHVPKDHPGGYVMAGHIHPALSLREKYGAGVRAPCFCFGERRAILPAFGTFTGLSTLSPQRAERFFVINSDEERIMEVAL